MLARIPFGKRAWKAWYEVLARLSQQRGAEYHCMNWGYEDGSPPLDEDERYPLQLYRAVTDGISLGGSTVADVSCGRGGGVAWIHATHPRVTAIGLDFSPRNVAQCRASFRNRHALCFEVGDAEALPFDAASVDVVVSVEASHCYRSRTRFLDEAARVLVPGGQLLWTDFCWRDELDAIRASLRGRFLLESDRDITPYVQRAMKLDAARRQALIERHGPPLLRPLLSYFAAASERADTARRFVTGRACYFLFQARRAGSSRPCCRDGHAPST